MKEKQTDMSRRHFIKNASLAGVAAGAAGLLGNVLTTKANAAYDARYVTIYESVMQDSGRIYARKSKCPGPVGPVGFEDRQISSNEIVATYDYDVVVVGGGISGMLSSLSAANNGSKVMVLEKMNVARGIFESFGAVNTKLALNSGRPDKVYSEQDKVDLIKQIYDAASWRLRRGIVHAYVERSGEAVDFMKDMLDKGPNGLGFNLAPGKQEHNLHVPFFMRPGDQTSSGRQAMYYVRELATVGKTQFGNKFDMRFNTPAAQLIRGNDGAVTGVIAKGEEGYIRYNARQGVILAAGGYDCNPDMMEAFCRSEDYTSSQWMNGSFGPTGDGHMMGLKAGALMDPAPHCIMYFYYPFGVEKFSNWVDPAFSAEPFVETRHIIVNGAGKRFMDEGMEFGFVPLQSNAGTSQEGMGNNIWQIGINKIGSPSAIENYKARGAFCEANSLRELAVMCGIDPEGLEKTVGEYNRYCDNGLDKEFGRTVGDWFGNVRQLNSGDRLDSTGKWYAVKHLPLNILTTVSGLQIDEHCQVLDYNDKPIPGLYAAGNNSGCFYSGHYPRHIAGLSVGRAITTGYIAGESASKA